MKMQIFLTYLKKNMLWLILSAASILLIAAVLVTTHLISAKKQELPTETTTTQLEHPAASSITTKQPPSDASGLRFKKHAGGTCSVIGIGSCTESELIIPQKSPDGDLVIAIGERAFADCTQLVSVSIPSGVKSIGEAAFSGCSSLVFIDVDRENEVYSSLSGVLYSKDKACLYCYPPNKVSAKYLLNENVTRIAPFAFYGNQNLEHLLYEKTVDSFRNIQIGEGNSLLSTITITCNYVGAKA